MKRHEQSISHQIAVPVWLQSSRLSEKDSSVAQLVSSGHQAKVQLNRRNVETIFQAVLFLGKQGLPFRGHSEKDVTSNRGNFLELLDLVSRHSPELKRHLEGQFTYTSPKIQNEMLHVIGSTIQRNIVQELNKCGIFGLICDETTDCSRLEQISICVRYVNDAAEVQERFLGFWECPKTDGGSLFLTVSSILKSLGVSMRKIRAQCYDGAANMNGKYSGLSNRIKEEEPRAVYIHCHAHILNLTLQSACSSIQEVRNALGTVNALYNLLEGSAKRHAWFVAVQKSLDDGRRPGRLTRLCETRWSSRHQSVHTVKSRFEAILKTLEEMAEADRDLGPEATILSKSVATFRFLFFVSVLDALLQKTAVLSEYLQGKTVELSGIRRSASSTIKSLDKFRSEEKFESFWREVEDLCRKLQLEEPSLRSSRRVTQVPRRLDTSGPAYVPQSPKDEFRSVYYEILDTIKMELSERFKSNEYEVLSAVGKLLLDTFTETTVDTDALETVCTVYGEDFDYARLKAQLELFSHEDKDEIQQRTQCRKEQEDEDDSDSREDSEESSQLPPGIVDLCVLFQKLYYRTAYGEVYNLLKTYLVIPVSSASSERSFSTLRRLKTWLRASMTEDRLSNVALMAVEREETCRLEGQVQSLVKEFSTACSRRLMLV